MTTSSTHIIVGGGLAGAKAAEALRERGFEGRIVLFGTEDRPPYERPPLSKEFLAGKKTLDEFTVHPADWYTQHQVELRLATTVTSLDVAGHSVGFADDRHSVGFAEGGREDYDKLLLATGSSSRRPPIPGADADGVHYLRTVEEASSLLETLREGATLAIVGAGWIGLEVAAAARGRDTDVVVVETADLPLLGALGPEAAEVFAQLHRDHGVDLRLATEVREITIESGRATGLRLGDGSTVQADAVLVAVGAKPNIELARDAGLATGDGGVLVDAALRTSDGDVYAVGDIAAAQHPLFGTRIRTEHWANALKQPAVAAAGMLGSPGSYDELPYFFTDQYDLGMEYVGHAAGYERAVFRGDVEGREFTTFWLDGDDRVLAGMNVNVWEGLDDIKALVRARKPVAASRLADIAVPLTDL
jgi:3-phenylpropionate/trans-cinnamate dioxygenase ferredoxin reductase subunit